MLLVMWILHSSDETFLQCNPHYVLTSLQEMRILSKLRHPNITTVMGVVMAASVKNIEPLLVMELMVCLHLFCCWSRQETVFLDDLGSLWILLYLFLSGRWLGYYLCERCMMVNGDGDLKR